MRKGRFGNNPSAVTAARHLREFGFTGWHLRRTGRYDPATDTLAAPENQVERQVVEALQYLVQNRPVREDGAVFLMSGEPRPRVGDGLVALTRHWLVDAVDVMDAGGDNKIYVVVCV